MCIVVLLTFFGFAKVAIFNCNNYSIFVQCYQRSALGRALHIGATLTIKPPQIHFVNARDAQAFQASF